MKNCFIEINPLYLNKEFLLFKIELTMLKEDIVNKKEYLTTSSNINRVLLEELLVEQNYKYSLQK
jgi:hypothetical protein